MISNFLQPNYVLYLHILDFWRRPHFDILINSIRPELLHENGDLGVGRTRTEIFVVQPPNCRLGIPTQPSDIWISILSSSDHQPPCWTSSSYWAPPWSHWRSCRPSWWPPCWRRWRGSGRGSPPRRASPPPRCRPSRPGRSRSAGTPSWKTKISIPGGKWEFLGFILIFFLKSQSDHLEMRQQRQVKWARK